MRQVRDNAPREDGTRGDGSEAWASTVVVAGPLTPFGTLSGDPEVRLLSSTADVFVQPGSLGYLFQVNVELELKLVTPSRAGARAFSYQAPLFKETSFHLQSGRQTVNSFKSRLKTFPFNPLGSRGHSQFYTIS